MEIVRGLTRKAYLLGAASLAVLLVGCAEQRTTGPERAKLDIISSQTDLVAVLDTRLTAYGADGKVQQRSGQSQTVGANFDPRGYARTVTPALRSFTVDSSGATPVLITYLAVPATGTLSYSYDETTVDSLGRVIRTIATGPADGSPVTDSYGYVNGVLATWDHSSWAPTTGGYLLRSQALNSYTNGTLTATVYTSVTTSVQPRTLTSRDVGTQFVAFSERAFDRVVCALAPKAAFASVPCLHAGLVLAGETIVLGTASALGAPSGATAVAVWTGAYMVGWGLWTDALYGFLDCVHSGGGGKLRGTRPVPQ